MDPSFRWGDDLMVWRLNEQYWLLTRFRALATGLAQHDPQSQARPVTRARKSNTSSAKNAKSAKGCGRITVHQRAR